MFNEQQSGKDQCNMDSEMPKGNEVFHRLWQQHSKFIIQNEMYQAIFKATALCGLTANALDIKEKKTYNWLMQIKDISKIHHVKIMYDGNKLQYQVWQYSGIGIGRKSEVFWESFAPQYDEKKPFINIADTLGIVHVNKAPHEE